MRIVYNLMGHFNPHSGGLFVLLNQMKALKECGFNVCVYIYWKEEQQSIVKIVEKDYELLNLEDLNSSDIVVVSEEFVWVANDLLLPKNIPFVLINQGISASFFSYNPYDLHKKTYENALGILSNSQHTTLGIKKLFNISNEKIYNFRIGIDSNLYYPENKEQTACYLSYKNGNFSRFIDVYFRGNFPEWNLIRIDGLSKEDTAAIFRKSKLFLSFGGPEGFGMPPLEAALCGCKVVGFDGYGGAEYFKESVFTKVNFLDYLDYIDKLNYVIKNADIYSNDDREYVEYLRNFYSIEKAKNSIIHFFNNISSNNTIKNTPSPINFIIS